VQHAEIGIQAEEKPKAIIEVDSNVKLPEVHEVNVDTSIGDSSLEITLDGFNFNS
jgi:hypothetical protein